MYSDNPVGSENILPDEIGIGIDFGMTYSGAAIVSPVLGGVLDLEVVPIKGEAGEPKFPTVVFVSLDKRVIAVGKDARMQSEPGKIYELFKGKLGTNWQDKDGIVPGAQFLTTEVLKAIKSDIDDLLARRGFATDRVKKHYVFSYPSAWRPEAHKAFEDAITKAGFSNFAMVDEAIATAIGAVRNGQLREIQGNQKITFVCDFGGGTTDFALIQATAEGFVRMMHAVGGDKLLGMSNLDKVIALLVARKMDLLMPSGISALDRHVIQGHDLENAWGEFNVAPLWKSTLLTASESLKRRVFATWPAFVSDSLRNPDGNYIEITKAELKPFVDAMLDALTVDVRAYLNEAKAKNNINESQIHYVFTGGGGSALPGIAETLQHLLPSAKVLRINADIATSLVQRGAAFHALNPRIYDRRVAHSYGVKTYRRDKPSRVVPTDQMENGKDDNGQTVPYYPYYEIYLKRGDKINSDSTNRNFTPLRADQKSVDFAVLCGEDDDPASARNKRVGVLTLPLPPHASRHYKITCTFNINDRGFLEVTAVGEDGKPIRKVFEWKIELEPD